MFSIFKLHYLFVMVLDPMKHKNILVTKKKLCDPNLTSKDEKVPQSVNLSFSISF